MTDALGAWFAPSGCTKRTPAKTVMEEIIITMIIIIMIIIIIIIIIMIIMIKERY